MLIRSIREEEQADYNATVSHPLQSWQWGNFRSKTGLKVERIGFFENGKLKRGFQVTFHAIPKIGKTIGYLPKGFLPDEEQLSALRQLASKHQAVYIKLEPNVAEPVGNPSAHHSIADFLLKNGAVAGKPLFTKFNFILDLNKSEEELFAALEGKTRYNVNLAYRKGVRIHEDTSEAGMEQYLEILAETTQRQGFYAHTPDYFRTMWQAMGNSGMMRIFHATYQDQVIVSWIMFIFNKKMYYPYGASRRAHREVMASNLMMWEMIRLAKEEGCSHLDMWGSLGPDANKSHPWYGFHKFKKGYGGVLYQSVGTYDLITDNLWYRPIRLADNVRWAFLRLRAKLPF